MLAAPTSAPPISEPMTWAAIREAYPDQYLLVDDVVRDSTGTIVTARVIEGVARIDRVRRLAKLRPHYPDAYDVHTGPDEIPLGLFAFHLDYWRRFPPR